MTVIEFVAFKINPHHVFCIAKSRKNWYSKDNISLPSDLEIKFVPVKCNILEILIHSL